MATTRREFLKGAGAAVAAGAVGFPAVARAQARKGVPADPVKIGVLAIRHLPRDESSQLDRARAAGEPNL